MYGKNCIGRKISLLNEGSEVRRAFSFSRTQHQRTHCSHLYPQQPPSSVRAHASNRAFTPSFSRQTPQPIHHEVRDSRSLGSPSPLTPSFNVFHEQLARSHAHNLSQQYFVIDHRYGKIEEPGAPKYAPPDAFFALSACATPTPTPVQSATEAQQPAQQLHHSPTSPSTEPSCISDAESNNNNCSPAVPKKKRHPCPLTKQYSCLGFFTTSGHAIRHARKHTGEKDAFCPECNRAFTREDNMKQHRRTHQIGRVASRQSSSSDNSQSLGDHQATGGEDQQQIRACTRSHRLAATELVSQPQMQSAPQQTHHQQQQQQHLTPPAMSTSAASDPHVFNSVDLELIPLLPMPAMISDASVHPPVHQITSVNSLDECLPPAQKTGNPDALSLSYQSPGFPNGLYNLALAASEHRRLSGEKVKRLPVTT